MDGAYSSMIGRLRACNNPSLFAMSYDRAQLRVRDLIIVPSYFFTEAIIEKRPPLGAHCRRAGWQGCNILLSQVPEAGRIGLIQQGIQVPKAAILEQWRATRFLRNLGGSARGWLIEVMVCVDQLGSSEFTLDQVYTYEASLSAIYPGNNNIRPKIRQQLQVLRDQGYLEFLGRGRYRRRT